VFDAVVDEAAHLLGLAQHGEALEGADADVAVAEAHQHRGAGRRGLVAADQRLAGLDQREGLGGVDAERLEHLGGEEFAHAALEGQASVTAARPGRLAGALGAEVEQAAVDRVAQLGEEEAATVADLGVVGAELVAVVAQGQRFLEAAGQGFEPAEMREPAPRAEEAEADAGGPSVISEAQVGAGKLGRRDHVVERRAECGMDGLGTVGGLDHRMGTLLDRHL
jgi:hypothetical protein